MPEFQMQVNVIEYGKTIAVTAKNRAEARAKARAGDWDNSSDPTSYRIQVVGSVSKLIDFQSKF